MSVVSWNGNTRLSSVIIDDSAKISQQISLEIPKICFLKGERIRLQITSQDLRCSGIYFNEVLLKPAGLLSIQYLPENVIKIVFKVFQENITSVWNLNLLSNPA